MAGIAVTLVFLAVLCAALGVRSLGTVRRGSRVARLLGENPTPEGERKPGWLEGLQVEASRAGLGVTGSQLALIALMGGALGFIIVYAITGRVDISLAGAGLALYSPRWWVRRTVHQRAETFEAQLEEVLERAVPVLKAGGGILPALKTAAEDMPDPIRHEISVILNQAQVMPVAEAFQRACLRVDSPDLEMVAVAVAVTQEYGGSLATVLERVADSIRTKRNFRERVAALTAESRLSANMMIAITLGMLAMLRVTAPSLVAPIFTTRTGLALFGVSLVMMGVGWQILAKQGDIKLE